MAFSKPSPGDHGRSELRERPAYVRAFTREQIRLGTRLRSLRHDAGLSQATAAERIGLSEKHLRRVELGKANVTLATLVACALVYKCGVGDLFAA